MGDTGMHATRRALLTTGGLVAAGMTMLPFVRAFGGAADFNLEEATIPQLQAAMLSGRLTAAALLDLYLARIQALDWNGPTLRSVQEINPDARASAQRKRGPGGAVAQSLRFHLSPQFDAANYIVDHHSNIFPVLLLFATSPENYYQSHPKESS